MAALETPATAFCSRRHFLSCRAHSIPGSLIRSLMVVLCGFPHSLLAKIRPVCRLPPVGSVFEHHEQVSILCLL
ncbi:unnamed protein product [Arctogadus glacialis]